MKKICTLSLFTFFISVMNAQQNWVDVWQNSNNFYEIKAAFENAYRGIDLHNVKGWKAYKRWEYMNEMRSFPSGNLDNYRQARLAHNKQLEAERNAGTQRSNAANWQFIGPDIIPSSGGGAGRINSVVRVPGTTNQFYVATPGGGIWKYDGTSWSTSTDFLSRTGAADLAIHPSDPNIIYAASGDNDGGDAPCIGMLKSVNGGTNWSIIGVTNVSRMYKLLMNPENPNTLFVSTSSGIYRTVNAGANWSLVSSLTNIRDMEYKPGDTTVIYAAQMNSATILHRSVNGGVSFSSSGVGGSLSVSGNGRSAIAVTPADPDVVYILTGNSSDNGFKGVYYSFDNGSTFVLRSSSPNLLGWSNSGADSGGQQWYDLAFAVSPTNKDILAVGGVNVWLSVNGGMNWIISGHWTGSGAPYVHADIHDLKFDANGTTVLVGCDGGIFRKDNITNSSVWEDLSSGLAIAQMYRMGNSAQSQEKVITGWQDNGTGLWTGPNTWRRVIGGDGMECIIDYSNDSYQYGELYYGNIRRSVNGGISFSTIVNSGGTAGTVGEDGDWVTPYVINPRNPQSLYVGKTRIYKSTDRGTTWTAHQLVGSSSSRLDAIAIAASDTNVIYTSKSNLIYRSSNDGLSYTDISSGLPGLFITYIAVDKNNSDKVYVTLSGSSSGNKVFMSSDGGASWTNISSGLPNLSCNTIVTDTSSASNGGMYAGMDAGVYYRDNSMSSWEMYNTNLPNVEITELEIQYAAGKLRASTYGRGLWQTDLATANPNAVTALFTSNTTDLCRTGSVQFTDQSTGNPLPDQWTWSFPGGTPSSSNVRNPVVTYNTAGIYNVTLAVQNSANATNTITLSNYITVRSVTPSLSVSGNTEVCAGSTATFNASGTNLGNAADIAWRINGVLSGATGVSYSSGILSNGSTIQCEINSTAQCAEPVFTQSNIIALTVKPLPLKPTIDAANSVLTSSNTDGNQWFRNGTVILSATGRSFNAVSNGTYTVQTTVNGCVSPMSDPKMLDIEGLFKIGPVPTPGDLNILFFVPPDARTYSIYIVNSLGQLIYKESQSHDGGLESRTLDVNRIAAGVYHITIVAGDKQYTRKFLKK